MLRKRRGGAGGGSSTVGTVVVIVAGIFLLLVLAQRQYGYNGNMSTSIVSPSSAHQNPPLLGSSSSSATRADAITAFINDITFSSLPLVYSLNPDYAPKNGEELALRWLIDGDPLRLPSSDTFRLRQRYALATLFFQRSVSRQRLTSVDEWLADGNVAAFSSGSVTRIDLSRSSLQGTIPADIGLLTSLQVFKYGDYLGGTLPSSIGQWTLLTHFDVCGISLTGTLPSSIGQWTSLQVFELGGHHFRGTLPSSIGVSLCAAAGGVMGAIPSTIAIH